VYCASLCIVAPLVPLYDVQGLTYGQMGEREKAIVAIKEALELIPNHADSINNLGTVYSQSEETM
jgi:Flp pilus assembly protein TadD